MQENMGPPVRQLAWERQSKATGQVSQVGLVDDASTPIPWDRLLLCGLHSCEQRESAREAQQEISRFPLKT